jgi:predicted nucleic acid-binding protein
LIFVESSFWIGLGMPRDATSFAVMRSLRIKEALAFDGDFAAAGFTELRV